MAKNKPKPQYSDAFFVDNLVLRHERTQHVYDRCGDKVIDALFGIAVILPNISRTAEIDEVSVIVKKTIESTFAELQAELARVDKLVTDNGITLSPRYSNPKNLAVRITSPRAGSFVGLFRRLDELLMGIDKLWFAEVWDESQKRKAVREASNRVMAAATEIFKLHKRAHLARQRKEGAAQGNVPKTETAKADTKDIEVTAPAQDAVTASDASPIDIAAPTPAAATSTPAAEAPEPAATDTPQPARRKKTVAV